MRRSHKRLLAMLLALPLLLVLLAWFYQLGMQQLEGQARTFAQALEWAAETMTSTGYGRDAEWNHPVMLGYVVVVQFAGVLVVFLVFPIFLIPFFEERFEGRLPTAVPDLTGAVVVYCFGPAVASLVDELERRKVPTVILEEDEAVARRLHERHRRVVLVKVSVEEPPLAKVGAARALVLNGEDPDNAALTLAARSLGFTGPIVALIENPDRRRPMTLAGASAAFTPSHMLAAAIAARASSKISPRVLGGQPFGRKIEVAELRIHGDSSLAGKTLAQSGIRQRTGATIIGRWVQGELHPQPEADAPLNPGMILVAAGSRASIQRLSQIARPITEAGPIVVAGFGELGRKVVQLLTDAGEITCVIHPEPLDGVDVVGDVLDRSVLEQAELAGARAVVLALESDSSTLFASTVMRDFAPEVPILAAVQRAQNVGRIHRAGADFAQSVGQVAGRLLIRHVLGEHSVSLQPMVKLVKVAPGSLVGSNPIAARVRERTGCSIVAVERGDEVLVDFDEAFSLQSDDAVYLCGTNQAVDRYYELYPEARP